MNKKSAILIKKSVPNQEGLVVKFPSQFTWRNPTKNAKRAAKKEYNLLPPKKRAELKQQIRENV